MASARILLTSAQASIDWVVGHLGRRRSVSLGCLRSLVNRSSMMRRG